MQANEMWELYCEKSGITHSRYDAWCFGSDPNELAALTKSGIKTATASLFIFYELENEPLPQVGNYSVILNDNEEAVCIIQTTEVDVLPFSQVSEEHAYKEGEGDRSLAYWRKSHEAFFKQELAEIQHEFDEDLLIVCETFEVVYA